MFFGEATVGMDDDDKRETIWESPSNTALRSPEKKLIIDKVALPSAYLAISALFA